MCLLCVCDNNYTQQQCRDAKIRHFHMSIVKIDGIEIRPSVVLFVHMWSACCQVLGSASPSTLARH